MVVPPHNNQIMETKSPLTITQLAEELRLFYQGNELWEHDLFPFNRIREFMHQDQMQAIEANDTRLVVQFNEKLPSVLSDLSKRTKHIKEKYVRDFSSAHEMYGVLYEEVSELFEEIRKNEASRDNGKLRNELVDIAVVCIRYLAEEKAKYGYL